jgi:hypothetical protein
VDASDFIRSARPWAKRKTWRRENVTTTIFTLSAATTSITDASATIDDARLPYDQKVHFAFREQVGNLRSAMHYRNINCRYAQTR